MIKDIKKGVVSHSAWGDTCHECFCYISTSQSLVMYDSQQTGYLNDLCTCFLAQFSILVMFLQICKSRTSKKVFLCPWLQGERPYVPSKNGNYLKAFSVIFIVFTPRNWGRYQMVKLGEGWGCIKQENYMFSMWLSIFLNSVLLFNLQIDSVFKLRIQITLCVLHLSMF